MLSEQQTQKLSIAKAAIIDVIQENLPVSYTRSEADGWWEISIDEYGEMTLDGYAEECINDKDWKNLPLSELSCLVESIGEENVF